MIIETTEEATPQDIDNEATPREEVEAQPSEDESPKSALEAAEEALDDLNGVEKTAVEEEVPAEPDAEDKDAAAQEAPANEDGDSVVPEGLSERASERFKKIIEKSRGFETQLQESNQQIESIKQAMQSSHANADDMGRFLEVTRLSHSNSVEDKRQALATLDKQRNALALSIGDAAPSTSALDAYPDLKTKVDAMEMDEEAAMQIAHGRHLQQQNMQQQQMQSQQQQQQFQQQQAHQQAIDHVSTLAETWSKSDPDYQAKEDLMMPQMAKIRETLPPEQWATATQLAYDSVSASFAARPAPRSPAPISKTGMAGSSTGKPKTAFEAAEAALGEL